MIPPSLQVSAARYSLGLASGEELSQVADALLNQGIYSYSLGELATAGCPTLRELAPLFVAALRELGAEVPTREGAVFTLMKEYMLNLAEGAEAPLQRTSRSVKEFCRLLASGAPDLFPAADSFGCQQLRRWAFDYEDVEDAVAVGDLDGEQREEHLAALDRQAAEFAKGWLREHWPLQNKPDWLDRHEGAVRKLAQAIHDGRRFGDLPILADALEEAGCDDPDILNHLRAPRVHRKGCWVVDALLGKG